MGLVLVAQAGVEGIKAGFGDPPRRPRAPPPLALLIEAKGQRLVDQAVGFHRQEQVGHKILEHGARPGDHALIIVIPRQHPAQPPPVARTHLSPGHCQVAGLPGLAGHQVIPALGVGLLFAVVADIEQPPLSVVKPGEVHAVGQRLRPPGQRILPPFVQSFPQGDQAGAQVARVHGGYIAGREGRGGSRVIPVVEMSVPLGQRLQRIQQMPDEGERLLPGAQIQVRRRQAAQQGHAGVGGRGMPGGPQVGSLLHVVGRQPVILRAKPVCKILPDQRPLVEQEGPVGLGRGPLGREGAAHGPGGAGSERPQKPRRRARRDAGEQDGQTARRHGAPSLAVIGPQAVPRAPFRVRRRYPGQQPPVRDQLPP